MKKYTVTALILSAILLLLCGCKNTEESSVTVPEPVTTITVTETEPAAEPEVGGDWRTWTDYVVLQWNDTESTKTFYFELTEDGKIRVIPDMDEYTVLSEVSVSEGGFSDPGLAKDSLTVKDLNGDGYDDFYTADVTGGEKKYTAALWNPETKDFEYSPDYSGPEEPGMEPAGRFLQMGLSVNLSYNELKTLTGGEAILSEDGKKYTVIDNSWKVTRDGDTVKEGGIREIRFTAVNTFDAESLPDFAKATRHTSMTQSYLCDMNLGAILCASSAVSKTDMRDNAFEISYDVEGRDGKVTVRYSYTTDYAVDEKGVVTATKAYTVCLPDDYKEIAFCALPLLPTYNEQQAMDELEENSVLINVEESPLKELFSSALILRVE